MILKNKFTRKQKCDICGEMKLVSYECEECYSQGFDIDKQIKHLQEIKKINTDAHLNAQQEDK